jgi:AraC-like DNA-binding protein
MLSSGRRQRYHHPFFIDLVDMRLKEEFVIPFNITEKNLSLFFLLAGEVTFCSAEGTHINEITSNSFLMSIFNPGKFLLTAKAGHHMVLLITMNPEWIETKLNKLGRIQKIVEMFHSKDNTYEIMLQCRIIKRMEAWLKKIYNYSPDNPGAIDGNLQTYVSSILQYYNYKMVSVNYDLAEQLKRYIEENLSDSTLSVHVLADFFCVTRFTLLNHFKRKYATSVQEFITTVRMERAIHIMASTGAKPTQVYDQVGYTDIRAFNSTMADYRKRKEK